MWDAEKNDIIQTARRLTQTNLISGTSGNVSMKLTDKNGRKFIAITPSSYQYDLLEIGDIAIVDMEGRQIDGNLKPSIEMSLHLEIYRKRPNITAIIHTHSVYATSVAVAGLNIPPVLDDQVVYLGGEIKVSKHALPGSKAMVKNVVSALGDKNAVLIANHGALCTGNNLINAYDNCHLLERLAEIYIHASEIYMYSLGMKKLKNISGASLEAELDMYRRYIEKIE
jgi:L-fuculose-phosphate aldolase